MTSADSIRVIRDHIETALFVADGLPTTPAQLHLRDTLIGALQEVHVLFPLAAEREQKGRAA